LNHITVKSKKLIKSNAVFKGKVTYRLSKSRGTGMRRAKLEMYIDILKVLAHMGPSKLTNIINKSNLDNNVINGYLDFLIKQGLVEERKIMKASSVFAVTHRGITVLKYFQELAQEISVIGK
jgi:predicted transcriptional regulator